MKSQIVDAEEKSASICFFAAYEGKFDFKVRSILVLV